MSKYATKSDFINAPLGHPFLECCGGCGLETGVINIKNKAQGRPLRPRDHFGIPKYLVNPDSRCEFCEFLSMWFQSEDIVPAETGLKYGAAKLVTERATGERDLIAFVPFSETEDRSMKLLDTEGNVAKEITLGHGMIIDCLKNDDGGMTCHRVLQQGT